MFSDFMLSIRDILGPCQISLSRLKQRKGTEFNARTTPEIRIAQTIQLQRWLTFHAPDTELEVEDLYHDRVSKVKTFSSFAVAFVKAAIIPSKFSIVMSLQLCKRVDIFRSNHKAGDATDQQGVLD